MKKRTATTAAAAVQKELRKILLEEVEGLGKRCDLGSNEATLVAIATVHRTTSTTAGHVLTALRGTQLLELIRSLYGLSRAKLNAFGSGLVNGKLVPIHTGWKK